MSVTKKDGKYVVRVYLGMIDGKKKYSHDTFYVKKEADDHDRKLKNFRAGNPDGTVSDKVLFSEVAKEYLTHVEATKEHNTFISYRSKYEIWIKPHLATFQIGKINSRTLADFKEKIRQDGIGESVFVIVEIVLFEIFKFATSPLHRYVMENPMIRSERKIVSKPLSSIQYLSKTEVDLFLTAAKDHPYYDSFVFILNTGVRFNEFACIQRESFDFTAGVLNVYEQIGVRKKDGASFYIKPTKGKEHRPVPLNKFSKKIAQKLIETVENRFLFCPGDTEFKKILIKKKNKTVIEEQKIVTNKTFAYAVESVCKKAGIKSIGPHGLRHTFAAHFLMNGGSIFTLSKLLGHKSVNTTIAHYGHLSEEFLKSTAHIVSFGMESR